MKLFKVLDARYRGERLALFLCSCGKRVKTRRQRGLAQQSCGCMNQRNKRHGLTGSPEYRTWSSMKARCTQPSHHAYANYGGRGIRVCERWNRSFESFLRDMGPRPRPTDTLERINNDGHYGPMNCTWIPRGLQARNRRTTRLIAWRGHSRTIGEWAKLLGLDPSAIRYRLKAGASEVAAISVPRQKPRNGVRPPWKATPTKAVCRR
jgi:hypothetical protein